MPEGPDAHFDGGMLRSGRFSDIYFSAEGGLGEAQSVFLDACGLPEGWAGRRHFSIGELGFGSGLNMLATLDLWRRTRAPGQQLHLFSVEAFPLPRAVAAEALAAFPDVAPIAARLLDQWPDGAPGMQRIDFPEIGARLDLAICDARDALAGWDGRADAWFLDGFAPAKNPDMWSAEVLALVGQRSAAGARLGTYTAAGFVREGLAAAGFTVERKPGFGRKRHRIEARFAGTPAPDAPVPEVAVIGAGISGAALALAWRDMGVKARLFAHGPTASGNPAALLTPRFDAGGGPVAALHAQAFRRSVARIRRTAPGAIVAEGALRLPALPRDPGRFATVAASGLFGPDAMPAVSAADAAGMLGESAAAAGLWMRDSLTIAPALLRAAWLGDHEERHIAGIDRTPDGWLLIDDAGRTTRHAIVCIAAGPGSGDLAAIPLRHIRGQASVAPVPFEGVPASWGHYCIPCPGGTLFGATHDRDDPADDVRQADRERNLRSLAEARPELAARLGGTACADVAGVRVAPRDTQPVAGRLRDGLFLLTGLGGRGFSLAPLLAEHVTALALGVPSPLSAPLARIVDPARLQGDFRPPYSGA